MSEELKEEMKRLKEELADLKEELKDEPKKERKIAPSQKSFAKAVLDTKYTGDMESFVHEVCQKIDIEPDQFGNYRAMVLSTGRMKGSPDFMQEAAKKLKNL